MKLFKVTSLYAPLYCSFAQRYAVVNTNGCVPFNFSYRKEPSISGLSRLWVDDWLAQSITLREETQKLLDLLTKEAE